LQPAGRHRDHHEGQITLESDRYVSNPAQIQVTTENKVVTLAGPVDSPATKSTP
jgi:osmotically-inducible protein OsmY